MNILIPMAGSGSRFKNSGYTKPKPFIDVNGQPMITRVIKNLYYPNSIFTLIIQKEHFKIGREIIYKLETPLKGINSWKKKSS